MTTYAFNEGIMFADVADGVAIVINSVTGIYYGLNEFGTEVFEAFRKGASFEGVLAAIQTLLGVPADAESKLETFVADLVAKDIFIIGEGEGVPVALSAEVATAANFELSCQAYDDAQEMLLADPIHEVKEDIGWTPEKDSIGYTKEETAEREKKMEQ